MRILLVAYEFPPLGGAGVRRSMGWAKYLPQFGIEPVVVTTDLESFQRTVANPVVDASLLHEVPPRTAIVRIPCGAVRADQASTFTRWRSVFFSLTDSIGGAWRAEIMPRLQTIIEQYSPEVICVSMPPFSMGPLWADISEQTGVPLVLDMRDAWSQWVLQPYATYVHYLAVLRAEERCLTVARHVVCTSEQTRRDLLRVHPRIAGSKISVITNGYDADVDSWAVSAPHDRSREFVIGYTGQFYYSPEAREEQFTPVWKRAPHRMLHFWPRTEDWLYRSPYFFLQAVRTLLSARPDMRRRLRIRFAGDNPAWLRDQVRAAGLDDMVEFLGYLDHQSVRVFQETCDCLLLTSSRVMGGEDYSIAGKTFDYFVARKPILAFVAAGAQRDILAKSGMAILCDPDDIGGSAARLGTVLDGDSALTPNRPFLDSLHRRRLTEQFAGVIREATHVSPATVGYDSVR
jgi:glycosyltransferase involved in cell wall biosynthesis